MTVHSPLPPLAELLTTGGDSRIVPNPDTGQNKYGCSIVPNPGIFAFGSSTASTISNEGFHAAGQLYERLLHPANAEPASGIYAREMLRIRLELTHMLGLQDTKITFAASGTDLHLLVSQLIASATGTEPPLVIIPEASETGSGVHNALSGRHFSECAAFSSSVTKGARIEGANSVETVVVESHHADGFLRSAAAIDSEVAGLVEKAAGAGRRVLLILVDASKTGLIAPSPASALALRERFPLLVDVLVDACQFRIAPSTLRAYLKREFIVAITGSKFACGPAFCGAMLTSGATTQRLSTASLPSALAAYSARADWPEGWGARSALPDAGNYGLLLRWEATLTHLRTFYAFPERAVTDFLTEFAAKLSERFATDHAFTPLPIPELTRAPLTALRSWDVIQTIFPFLLRGTGSGYKSREETQRIYERLRSEGYYLGQPVICGARSATPVSALRLCAGMQTVVDALTGKGKAAVIADALALLDKTAALAAL